MRRAAVIVFAGLCLMFAIIEYWNFTGFCYTQARWLSDADLIRHAIQYNLQKQPKGAWCYRLRLRRGVSRAKWQLLRNFST